MARRSLGVVLIVTLLGWSVNQPATACTGMRPRAAAVVQAGASPASPEPSLTRHICCPGKKSQTAVSQPSPLSNCSIRPTPDRRYCTVSEDSQGLPSPRRSVKPPTAKMFVLIPNALSPSPRSASRPLRLFLLHRLPSLPGSPFYAIETFLPYSKDLLFACPRETCFPLYDRLRFIKTLRWKK